MDPDRLEAAAAVGEVAREHLLNPPTGADPVIEFANPDALLAVFAESIPIPLGDDVPARSPRELEEAARAVVRFSVRTSHPRFFNQNFAGADPVAVAGDWLGSVLNTTNATYEAAPVFTLMEGAVLRKLAQLVGYEVDHTGPPPGLFAPGGSTATLYALQLARFRDDPESVDVGSPGQPYAVFVSATGHYAAVKSAALLGMGRNAVQKVAVDNDGVMSVDDLRRSIERSRADGRRPLAVIATAGTTVHAAFDPIDRIAEVCADEGDAEPLWLHVDGCYGGSALFSSRQRHRLAGAELSDSFVWNLHKMMGITQQCTALLIREPHRLGGCFATQADYLFQPDKLHGELDSGDHHFQCARRNDVLKLWLSWHANGDDGFEQRIDRAVERAHHLRTRIAGSDGEFAIVAPGDFTNVLFVWVPPELRPLTLADLDAGRRQAMHELPPRMKQLMQAEGTAMIGFQPVDGLNCFRWLFMNDAVTNDDVDAILGRLREYGEAAWDHARMPLS